MSRRNGRSSAIERSRTVFRRLDRNIREGLGMLNELDELIDITHERFARYTIDPDERIEDVRDDVLGLLVQARLEHPGQELEVIFRARLEPSREETHHGRTGRHVRR